MSRLHIIGIGSPWGLDRVALLAVQALQDSDIGLRCAPMQLEFMTLDRPGSRLLDLMATLEHVLLLDALQCGRPIASLVRIQPQQLETIAMPFSSHGFGLLETLKLGLALQALPPRWALYGIEVGKSVFESQAISSAQALADRIMPRLYDMVLSYVQREGIHALPTTSDQSLI